MTSAQFEYAYRMYRENSRALGLPVDNRSQFREAMGRLVNLNDSSNGAADRLGAAAVALARLECDY